MFTRTTTAPEGIAAPSLGTCVTFPTSTGHGTLYHVILPIARIGHTMWVSCGRCGEEWASTDGGPYRKEY